MPAQDKPNDDLRLFSDVIEELGEGDDPKLKLEELVAAFGERGFGAMILILSMLALLPWPPGGKAVFAVPIILMSLELAFQRSSIWLPRWALRTSISRPAYRAGVSRIMKTVRYVENLTQPRLPLLTGEVADTITGLVCVLLALIMALPMTALHCLTANGRTATQPERIRPGLQRGPGSRPPHAIDDNETLDHLLSTVEQGLER